MKVSLRWLRDYAPLDAPLENIVRTLVDTGTEVGEAQDVAAGIIVARVTRLEPVPGSTHGLQIADIDVGPQPPRVLLDLGIPVDPLRVVTGAPNVSVGDLVAYAPPGTRPPAMDEPLGVRSYRKLKSPGMLCSPAELGVGADAGGLLVLDHGAPGRPLRDVVDLDVVLDVEVTTNRPDCLCHLGIARELAAGLSESLSEPNRNIPAERQSAVQASQRAIVRVEDPDGCLRFAARVHEDVRIAPSPAWMQERLRAIGQRPINNVVDVTNFVSHELGQPMHAFDLDKLIATAGADGRTAAVVIRRARDGERLQLLDGSERQLTPGDIVVCADDVPVSLAGVMGGAATAVDDSTRNVLLEAASWDAVTIRATSRRFNLRTDASGLFEKGLSDTLPPVALDRAARLISECAGGHVLAGIVDEWVRHLPEIAPISLSAGQISAVLGTQVDATEAATVLAHLGFAVEQDGSALIATPPPFRRDVVLREDVIEEVGRMLGYDRVPATLPGRRVPLAGPAPWPDPEDAIRDVCNGAGFDEAITYSFTSPRAATALTGLAAARTPMRLRNPLTEDWSVLRVSQLPGLCQAIALNVNRGVQSAALFELGRVFWDGERSDPAPGSTADGADAQLSQLPLEPLLLSVALHCPGSADDAANAVRRVQSLFHWLVRELDGTEAVSVEEELAGIRAGRGATVRAGDTTVAMLGELDLEARDALDLRGRVVVGELNVDALLPRERRPLRFQVPPRHPAIVQDVAVIVPRLTRAGEALAVIRQAGGPLLEDAQLYDEYREARLGDDRKGWTFHLTFRAPDRTLTSEEAQAVQADIVETLQRTCRAEMRR